VNVSQASLTLSLDDYSDVSPLTGQVRALSRALREDESNFELLDENILALEQLIFAQPLDSAAAKFALAELSAEERVYLNDAYCRWETGIEFRYAEDILSGREKSLDNYQLSSRFDFLLRNELALLPGPVPERVLFIGSGPLPISAFYFHSITGKPIDCLDRDPEAVKTSRQVIDKLGLSDSIRVFNGVGEDFKLADYGLILVALLAKPKRRILRNIRKKAAPDCRILCRTSFDLRTLVYEPTPADVLLGFEAVAKQVAEGEQTISTLLLEGTAYKGPDIKLRWLETIDERIATELSCLINRVLERETTIGFPGPLDPDAGRLLISQMNEDLKARRRHVLIAEKGDTLVGQVILTPHHLPNCRHLIELSRGIIDPSYRGAGLALSAFKAIAEKCEELSSEVIYLDVRAGTMAAELWKSFGFVPFGKMPDYARVGGRCYQGLYMSQTVASLKGHVARLLKRGRSAASGALVPMPSIAVPKMVYRPRHVHSLPLIDFSNWRLKVYDVTAEGTTLEPSLITAAQMAAQSLLSQQPVTPPQTYGVGFVIVHAAPVEDTVLLCWWGKGDELFMRTFTCPAGKPQYLKEHSNREGPVASVWSLGIIGAERELWIKHAMHPDGMDLDSYLFAT
jgi:GNAT superfamily N-acetyltransferase